MNVWTDVCDENAPPAGANVGAFPARMSPLKASPAPSPAPAASPLCAVTPGRTPGRGRLGPPMRTPVALAPASPPRGASTVTLVAVRTPKSLLEEVGSAMSVTPARRSVRHAGDAANSPVAALATAGFAYLPNPALPAGTPVAERAAPVAASPAPGTPGAFGRGASPEALATVSLPWATPTPAQARLQALLSAPATAPSKLQRALAEAQAAADAEARLLASPPRTVGAAPRPQSATTPAPPSPLVSVLYDSDASYASCNDDDNDVEEVDDDDVAAGEGDDTFDFGSLPIDVSYAAVSPVPTPDQTALLPLFNPLAMRAAAMEAAPSPLTAALTARPQSPLVMTTTPTPGGAFASPLAILSPVEALAASPDPMPALAATPAAATPATAPSPRRLTIAGGASPLAAGGTSPVSDALAALLADAAAATPAPTPRAEATIRVATPATERVTAAPEDADATPGAAGADSDSPMGVFVRVMAGMLNAAIAEREDVQEVVEAAEADVTEAIPAMVIATTPEVAAQDAVLPLSDGESMPSSTSQEFAAVADAIAEVAATPASPVMLMMAASASPHVTPRSEQRRTSLSARKASATPELAMQAAMPEEEAPPVARLSDVAFAPAEAEGALSPPTTTAAAVTPRSAARRRSMAARKSFAPEEAAEPEEVAPQAAEDGEVQESVAAVVEEVAAAEPEAAPKRGRGRKAAPPADAAVEEAAPPRRATRGRAANAPPADLPVAAEAAPPKRGRGKAAAAPEPAMTEEEAAAKPAGRATRTRAAPSAPEVEPEVPAPRARRTAKAAAPEPSPAAAEAPRRSTRSRK